VIENIPPPKGDPEAPLQAMIFDSQFNSFRGVEVISEFSTERLKKAIGSNLSIQVRNTLPMR